MSTMSKVETITLKREIRSHVVDDIGWDGMIGQKPGGKIRKRKYKIYTCSSSIHAGQLSGADDSTASTAH